MSLFKRRDPRGLPETEMPAGETDFRLMPMTDRFPPVASEEAMEGRFRLTDNLTADFALRAQEDEAKAETALPSLGHLNELKQRIHARFLEEADVTQVSRMAREELTAQVRERTFAVLEEEGVAVTEQISSALIESVVCEILGYGPLEPLLNDASITEIMVNGARDIYIERGGRLARAEQSFIDDTHVMRIIERIVAPIGRRIDESSPMVDARLPDGSRVNAVIPPLAIKGPCLTVRKFSRTPFTADDLIRLKTLTPQMVVFLRACIYGRLNILISGGTGSGKTTTLNVLSSFIPADERIVTIEDAAELQLQQEHVVTLESRPPNLEGKGEITIRQLVRNALRMRPDRIIVGETRGGEALDMLQAMNTGHDGSMSTLHANSPRDALSRIETMVLMAGTELPVRAIREQIASALNLVIHQSRLRDGSRKITHIAEVQGMEGDVILLQDIFLYEQHGVNERGEMLGEMRPTGLRPLFVADLLAQGVAFPTDLFTV
ncbi:MAG TPA: CpaF family protein [Chthonomonadaceae bacterium]|nr:CpaF family protein [Chthonomonadaceae bacterium]